MIILPAIDLRGGKAVRLTKGDYDQMKVYNDDPASVAAEFATAGAEWLHVVDLDGAREGIPQNAETIRKLTAVGLFTEVGGGIRTAETVQKYLDAGVLRVILGTVAVSNPDFVTEMIQTHGRDRIAVGMDFRKNVLAVKGWTEDTQLGCFDFCADMEKRGVRTIIATNIVKDGMLDGVSVEFYREFAEIFGIDFIASGGVTSLDDVKAFIDTKVAGVILGKSLYEGAIDLRKALRLAAKGVKKPAAKKGTSKTKKKTAKPAGEE